ncbi:MAG TPA: IDEAL domain-containing protein [Bacillota bacterium]|nr:IDEAL domain-containing protein [Bacillota bacterium]
MMKKQISNYRHLRYEGSAIQAKREISYEIKLSTRLILDELCYQRNKDMLEAAINDSIDNGNKEEFLKLSATYNQFVRS